MAHFATDPTGTPEQRLEEFQTAASTAFAPLAITANDPGRMWAGIRAEQVGGLLVSDLRTSACTVRRDRRQISSTDNDVYKVALQVSGRMVVAQDGRRNVMLPGDMAIYDTTRPYTLVHHDPALRPQDDFRTIVVTCPRSYFASDADVLRQVVATPKATGRGVRRLVAGFFTGLADELDGVATAGSGQGGLRLADSLVDMIALVFAGREVPVAGRAPLLDRMLAYCEANLSDPDLSPRTVARAHRVSVRYVHRLFSGQDQPLSSWIRARRLDRIRQDLENPQLASRTVAAVAARWGLLDAPHVSRAFRAAYGISPAEYRRHALRTRAAFGTEARAAGIRAPETRAPETRAPGTRAPGTRAPGTRAPEVRTTEVRSGVSGSS
ncbi:helix-turn-helix domain-containing protein [Actinosynnema sp. NPDC047251]|uniref:Transcriptional regulator, AraC family n=1 Tax=Saccharothrix espanaensis (strain ATCC 51144 / DSM 44229 / JCM 9112 / NBRC 15066 / NRRL 15764) TaxID=1179773 RepID=K0JU86_SACES|nr:helix-turn-helix domain-containing protein [Saccharothrix espanaensis]CCH31395.1 Transcriptional regulator, AraC family [Saccharothrix espanaensis DSM 44229]